MKLQLNKAISLDLNIDKLKLSNKQKWVLKYYSDSNVFSQTDTIKHLTTYISSLMGQRANYSLTSFKRQLSNGNNYPDKLANKDKNYYLNKMLARYDALRTNHSPNSIQAGNALGIEIECIMPNEYSREDINARIKSMRIKNVTIKGDGSITDFDDSEFSALEFTIITDIHDMTNLKALCELLKDMGAYVNKTCGLHVHLDCRDVINMANSLYPNEYDKRNRYIKNQDTLRANRLVWALPLLTKMLPSSRLTNRFCKYGKSSGRSRNSRYFMVNTRSLSVHNTIEVRAHSGTIDFTKISEWARICFSVSRATGARYKSIAPITDFATLMQGIRTLKDKVRLDNSSLDYMLKRIQQFNPKLLETNLGTMPVVELGEEMPVANHWTSVAESNAIVDEIPF